MTVNTTNITSGPYAGNGVADTFSYTFRVTDKSQLSVYETDDNGVQTLLTVDTDYTVAGIGDDDGGTITRVAGALPSNYEWFIRSNYKETQLTAFESQGAYFPDLHENMADKLTFLIQQLRDTANRSIRVDDNDSSVPGISMVLPDVATRALKFLFFDAQGQPIPGETIDPTTVPSQSGEAGKFLGTDGSQLVWKDGTQTYETVADAVADTTLVLGQFVAVENYASDIPSGLLFFKVVAGSTGTANGGKFIDLNNGLQLQQNFRRDGVNVRQYGAKCDGSTIDNTAVQNCMDDHLVVIFPAYSVTRIDPSDPLIVRQGQLFLGSGLDSTVIYPTAVGGTVFKRVDTATDSSYVRNVIFDGIAVVLNHPATADPGNYEQIAFDFRSISRGILRNCYAGNYNRGPLRLTRTDPADQQDAIQGYGVVIGTDNVNYAGGEVNTVDTNQFYGLKKCVAVDDLTLSPASAAYATRVVNNDIQITEEGVAFASQFNAGSVILDNTVQAVKNARGSSATTSCYRLASRDCFLRNKYVEVTIPDCDKILRLDSTAKRNVCDLGLIGNSDTFIPLIDSASWGNHNKVSYFKPSTNELVRLDGGINAELGRDKARVLFDATGAIQGTSMAIASVVRNAVGDFNITFNTNTFADANYTYSIDLQIDGAGSAGSATVRVQNSTNIRVVTRDAAGTPVDPLRTSIRCG